MKTKQSPAQARRNAAAAAKETVRKAKSEAYATHVAATREADKLRALMTPAKANSSLTPVDAQAEAKAAFDARLAKSTKVVVALLTGLKA